jgi:hypothetical protein
MFERFLRTMVRTVIAVVALVQAKKDVVFVIGFLWHGDILKSESILR